jgi:hypothetical protein
MEKKDVLTFEQVNTTIGSMREWAEALKTVIHGSPDLPDAWAEPAEQILAQMSSLEEKFPADPNREFEIKPHKKVNVEIHILGRTC